MVLLFSFVNITCFIPLLNIFPTRMFVVCESKKISTHHITSLAWACLGSRRSLGYRQLKGWFCVSKEIFWIQDLFLVFFLSSQIKDERLDKTEFPWIWGSPRAIQSSPLGFLLIHSLLVYNNLWYEHWHNKNWGLLGVGFYVF